MAVEKSEIFENRSGRIFHPMTAPSMTRQNPPLVIARGEGVYVWDVNDKRYLDSQAGLWCVNVGHGRAEVNKAIADQLERIAYYSGFTDTTNRKGHRVVAPLNRHACAREHVQRVLHLGRVRLQRDCAQAVATVLEPHGAAGAH